MKAYLPEFRIEKLLLDAAHDASPVYEYCRRVDIAFIDLNPGHTGHFTYKDDFTIDAADGVPVCKMGLRMHKDGYEAVSYTHLRAHETSV